MKRMFRSCVWLVLLAGCGVTQVELGSRATDEIVIGNVPRAAIDTLSAMGADRSDPARLSFVYPSDGLVLPENIAPISFQWQSSAPGPAGPMTVPAPMIPPAPMQPKAPKGSDGGAPAPMPKKAAVVVFELHVRGPNTVARLYTVASTASLPENRWRALLRGTTDAQFTVELRALFMERGETYRAAPLHVSVRGPVPAGALYVWSTTAQGLLRAHIDQSSAVYIAPASAAGSSAPRCAGCHAVSRDGRRLLAGAGSPAQLVAWSLPGLTTTLPRAGGASIPYGWGTFDPTASRIATTSAGVLRVLDADDGEALPQATLPDGTLVSHPDWSPDGRFIALTLLPAQSAADDENVTGSSIARVHVALDGSLEAPEVLVAPMGKDDTLLFPAYSPDGEWIAFERVKGASKEANEASLWLVRADGGAPLELKHAQAMDKGMAMAMAMTMDKGMGMGMGKAHGADSMPTWMPGARPGAFFLLFSSTRDYGSTALLPGQEQLFASEIDTSVAEQAEDPSHPAFWLPFQDATSSYHRALWAPEVAACVAALEQCNGHDDDCDGVVDEACCTPRPEACGDGRDDDCDGIADEGCGCAPLETCGNAVDDDCDGRTDEDCG